nr:PREDICTED: uncharacterized protein LOC105662491 [Megachile rotundata]
MVVSTMWIRNNMLFSPEQCGRQLTDAELKVQRSLQKLSVPDWYLNRRSNSPKIVNDSPIEIRPPSWRCPTPKKSTNNSSYLSGIYVTSETPKNKNKSTNNNASRQEKSPELKHEKSSCTKEEIFDTWIPEVHLPTNVSKTFPKVSPSRKIKNINLVLPPGPNLEDEIISSNCDIFRSQVQSSSKDSTSHQKKSNVKEIVPTSVKTPIVNGGYRFRTNSSPKFSPAQIFSSTVIEDDNPKPKKKVSPNIREKSSIFESRNPSESSIEICQTSKDFSQNPLEKTFILDGSRADQSSRNYESSSMGIAKDSCIFEKNIYSIEPIVFEKDDTALSMSKSSSMVREMVKKLEMSNNSFETPHKISTLTWKKQTSKKSNYELKLPSMFYQKRFDLAPKSPIHLLREEKPSTNTQSPCTRFLNSVRKSTDLENVVRSKQTTKEKGVVRGIIETLAEKVNQSTLPRQKQATKVNQNFVRKVVTALENVDRSRTGTASHNRRISLNEDTGSGSESEFKSYTTSNSAKDTDSDSDQRTPSLKSDDDGKFTFAGLATTNVYQEDDSVYWIPVSKCKLPRTSSLLSMMSKLSENGHSPCLSPIRADSELEYQHQPMWDLVYTRTKLSRKLFRIDETVVIDSGYSDKSDRSGISSRYCMEDSSVGP